MRLVRVEAERFGRIDGRSLSGLSPKLTVVYGLNESGKSSITAVVRYALYGYPTRSDPREPTYVPASGGRRLIRLVFEEGKGEWVVERADGPNGGSATVRTLSGDPRERLVEELTQGVRRNTYRVVFGFGMSELQHDPSGVTNEVLVSALLAAGAGLEVGPADLRAELASRMGLLFKARGATQTINKAKADREDAKSRIRQLETEAEALRLQFEALAEARSGLDAARSERASTQARSEALARIVSEVERLTAEATSATLRAQAIALEAQAARTAAEAAAADTEALECARAVAGLVAESASFGERLIALAEQQAGLVACEQRIAAALDAAGWTSEQVLAATADAGVTAEVESARAELENLKARAELTREARDRAVAEAAGAAAVDAAQPVAAPARPLPAIVSMVLGVAGVIAGLVTGQQALTLFGGIVAAAGVLLALVRTPTTAAVPDEGGARTQAAAESSYAVALGALADRSAAWDAKVREWGLGTGGEEPAAIFARLQAAREVRAGERERSSALEVVAREQERVEAWTARVRASVAPLLGEEPAGVTPERCIDLVGRASARVEAAAAAARTRAEGLAVAERLEREAQAARDVSAAASAGAVSELASAEIDGGGPEDARRAAAEARVAAGDALEAFDTLTSRIASLSAGLDAQSREDRLSALRLEEETANERIAAAVEEYAVLALASELLAKTQQVYERDRQPDVVRHAEEVFGRMTQGRYPRIHIPMGSTEIEVFDVGGAAIKPDVLSRGAAEQLSLALRLGLVEHMGDAKPGLPVLMDDVLVDFDPQRVRPAAQAIADLAERRQVLFFTCHPATAELLANVSPEAVRIDLDGPPVPRG